MAEEKVQRNDILHGKIVCPALGIFAERLFSLDKYQLKIQVENSVFAVQHIGNGKKVLVQAYFAYSCSFTLHASFKNGIIGQSGEGCQNVRMLEHKLL